MWLQPICHCHYLPLKIPFKQPATKIIVWFHHFVSSEMVCSWISKTNHPQCMMGDGKSCILAHLLKFSVIAMILFHIKICVFKVNKQ